MSKALSTDKAILAECEAIIESGLPKFFEVGAALLRIRDNAVYETAAGFNTFEEYCKKRWGFSEWYAYKLTSAANVVENLDNCPILPKTESQARPLTKLEPEQQPRAWQRAVEIAEGEQPTAKQVEAAVEEVLAPEPRSKPVTLSVGMEIARRVILQLQTITSKDAQKDQALRHVEKWCQSQLSK